MTQPNQKLLAVIQRLTDAVNRRDPDTIDTLFAPDLQMVQIQTDGTTLRYNYAQNRHLFRTILANPDNPPMSDPERIIAAEEHNGIGFVVLIRHLGIGSAEQDVLMNIMLRRNAAGRWQIFREHNVFQGEKAA